MTPKEALDLTFRIYDTKYGDKQLTILNLGLSFEETEECKTVLVEALNELEELKHDVSRYFALEKRLKYISENANTPFEIENMKRTYRETLKELHELEEKLLKVGKEE